jgi:hypothetical protein
MRTREAKHPLHSSAWFQKRGQATIDNQLSEDLKIFRPRSHAKYVLFEAQRGVQANMPRLMEGNLHFAMTRWRIRAFSLSTLVSGAGRWPAE